MMQNCIFKPLCVLLSFLLIFSPIGPVLADGNYKVKAQGTSNYSGHKTSGAIKGQVSVGQNSADSLNNYFASVGIGRLHQYNILPECTLTSFTNGEVTRSIPDFRWTYLDKDKDIQRKFYFQLADNPKFTAPIISDTQDSSGTSYSPQTLADGAYYWRLMVYDGFGWSGWKTCSKPFLVDREPPWIDYFRLKDKASLSEQWTNSRTVKVELSETDNILYSPDGGFSIRGWIITEDSNQPAPARVNLTLRPAEWTISGIIPEGKVTLYAWVKDKADNVSVLSANSQDDIILDLTPPQIKILTPLNGSIVGENMPLISAEFIENNSGIDETSIELSIDGEAVSYIYEPQAKKVFYTPDVPLTKKQHKVLLRVMDNAGNTASSYWSFTINYSDTEFTITEVTPLYARKDSLVTIKFSASQDLKQDPYVAINGNACVKMSSTGNEYAYTYKVSADDAEGWANIEIIDAEGQGGDTFSDDTKLCIDLTKPNLGITDPADNYFTAVTPVTIYGTVADLNLDSCTINGKAVTPRGPQDFEFQADLQQGLNTFNAIAVDKAGNTATLSLRINFSIIPPDIIPVSPAPLEQTAQVRPVIKARYSDPAGVGINVSTVKMYLDGIDVSANCVITASEISYTPASDLSIGPHGVTVSGENQLGYSGSASWIWTVISTKVVPPDIGGEVISDDGNVKIIIPAGATTASLKISIANLPITLYESAKPKDTQLLSVVRVDTDPKGIVFAKPVLLSIKLAESDVPGTAIDLGLKDEPSGKILFENQAVPVRSDGRTVDFSVTHFSTYAALKNLVSSGAPIGAGTQIPLPDMFTGSFGTSLPIIAPPGRRGIAPSLSLNYRSNNANSWVGLGFSLNPGYIERSTKSGQPLYDDKKDTFYFITDAGTTELVHLTDNVYQARIETSYAKFYKDTDDSWRVVQKDGSVLYFGKTTQSKIVTPKGAFKWALDRAEDLNTNYVSFSYASDQNQLYLSRIDYTGHSLLSPKNSLEFFTEVRQDVFSDYRSGIKVTTSRRLREIQAKSDGKLSRKYLLNYQYTIGSTKSLLTSVTQYGTDGITEYPAWTAGYQKEDAVAGSGAKLDISVGASALPLCADFNGDGRTDLLSASESGNWVVAISDGASFAKSTWLSGFKPQDLGAFIAGDFNQDGLTDIGGWDKNSRQWKAALSTGQSFSAPQAIAGPQIDSGGELVNNGSFSSGTSGWSSWASDAHTGWESGYVKVWRDAQGTAGGCGDPGQSDYHDWNGYFEQEISTAIYSGQSVQFSYGWMQYKYTNNGSASTKTQAALIKPNGQEVVLDSHQDDYRGGWTLFNQDISSYFDQTGKYRIRLQSWGYVHGHRGGGYAYAGGYFDEVHLVASGANVTSGDFNADGQPDLLLYSNDGTVKVNLGAGLKFASSADVWLTNFGGANDWVLSSGDFNADGLTDLCAFNKNSGAWKVALSDGLKFIDAGIWMSSFGAGKKPITGDFNYDGTTDIGYFDSSSGTWTVAFSNGSSFGATKQWISGFGANKTALTGDFDADGLTDAFYIDTVSGSSQAVLTKGAMPNLLNSIDNGTGGKTTIAYSPSNNLPATKIPFSTQVVTSVSVTDSLPAGSPVETYSQEFSYEAGYYDAKDREFRGFGKVKARDPITGNYTLSHFLQGKSSQDGALKAQVEKILSYDGSGNLISQTLNEYQVKRGGPKDKGLGFPSLKQTSTTVWEKGVSLGTVDEFSYDNIGNVTEVLNKGDIAKQGDEKYVTTKYRPGHEAGFNRILETSFKDKDKKEVTKKNFEYDDKGNLKKEIVSVYNPITKQKQDAISQYSYDLFGNVTSSIDALNRVVTTEYESEFYAFPKKVTNSLGQSVEYVYDSRFGAAIKTTDTNGTFSTVAYDALGRVTEARNSVYPNPVTTYSYPDFNTKVTKQLNLTTTEYADGLGRKYKAVSSGEDGANPRQVSSETYYNNRGFVEKESIAHYIDEAADNISYVRYEYDNKGRIEKTLSDFPGTDKDAESSIDYISPLYTETIDPLGHKKGARKDIWGNITEVTEFTKEGNFKTAYEYDIQNNLTKIIDSKGNISTIFYDSVGRKIKMNDPDMGVWSYEYDVLGNLIKQTDAKGQILEFEYDALNRLKKKQGYSATGAPDLTVEYLYDKNEDGSAKANCIGRLSKVKDGSGSTEFFYDALGREIKSVKTVSGAGTYAVEREYDILSRLTKLTYPDGETVSYTYDINSGLLESVSSFRAAAGGEAILYVKDITYNAKGQLKDIQYGNSTQTDYTYGADLRLSRINTSLRAAAGGEAILYHQDLTYAFDKNGNITALIDNLRSNTRAYTYDDLDRLTQAKNIPSPAGGFADFSYQYDAIGNMIYKSDLGPMEYGSSAGPHAVTRAGNNTYTYDANGNMIISGANKTLQYDIENRLTKVDEAGIISEFLYDGDGGRVRKSSTKDGEVISTAYIGSLYEIDSDGTTRKHIFAGSNRVCTASLRGAGDPPSGDEAILYAYYHTDHLGSSNVITDGNGAQAQYCEYTPYGITARNEGADIVKHKFTGKELDSTGLYYYGARYYDSQIGRFITADTIIQSPYDPQSLNRYAYCRNNPIKYIDPSGHLFWFIPIIIGIVKGAVLGSLIGGIVAAATGGNIGQGFLTGAISGAFFGGVGSLGLQGFAHTVAHTVAGAMSGAINASITGGDIGMGALIGGASAGASEWMGSNVGFLKPVGGKGLGSYLNNVARRAAVGAIVGGGVSAATGGDFWQGAQQGAVTSAIAYTANDWLHDFANKLEFVRKGGELAKQARSDAGSSGLSGEGRGPQDAYRHARWNELMREEIGSFRALLVSTAHEIFDNQVSGKEQTFADFRMDMHNNFMGAYSQEDAMSLYSSGKLKVLETHSSEYKSGY